MWSSNFVVEVTMKFGVVLLVTMNEARKNPRNPASCQILKGVVDAIKNIEKEIGWVHFFKVICTLLHPP